MIILYLVCNGMVEKILLDARGVIMPAASTDTASESRAAEISNAPLLTYHTCWTYR